MLRRSAVSVFALVVAFALGALLTSQPSAVIAQPAATARKCIGITPVVLLGDGVGSIRQMATNREVTAGVSLRPAEFRYASYLGAAFVAKPTVLAFAQPPPTDVPPPGPGRPKKKR